MRTRCLFCSKASRSLAACNPASSGAMLQAQNRLEHPASGQHLLIEDLSSHRPAVELLQRLPVQSQRPVPGRHRAPEGPSAGFAHSASSKTIDTDSRVCQQTRSSVVTSPGPKALHCWAGHACLQVQLQLLQASRAAGTRGAAVMASMAWLFAAVAGLLAAPAKGQMPDWQTSPAAFLSLLAQMPVQVRLLVCCCCRGVWGTSLAQLA